MQTKPKPPFYVTFSIKRFIALMCLWVLLIVINTTPTFAQSVLATSGDKAETRVTENTLTSPEAVRAMVARLSDQEVRDLLLRQLDAQVKPEQTKTETVSFTTFLQNSALGVIESVSISLARVHLIPASLVTSSGNFYERHGAIGILRLFGVLILALIVAIAAVLLVRHCAREWQQKINDTQKPDTLLESFKLLSMRFLLDLLALATFSIVTYTLNRNLQTPDAQELARLLMLHLVIIPLFFSALSRFLLAPKRPELRLLYTDDWSARFLYKHQLILFVMLGLSDVIINFNAMHGVPIGQTRFGFWINIAIHIYIIYIVWNCREGLIKTLMGRDQEIVTEGEKRVIRLYPWFIIVTTLITWLIVEIIVSHERFDLLANNPHHMTIILFMFAPALDTLVRGLVSHLTPPMTGEGLLAQQAYMSTKRTYIRIGRVFIISLVVFALAGIWGIGFQNIASGGFGAQVASNLFEMTMVIAAGYMCWELVTLWINRKLAAEQTAAGIDLTKEEPAGGEGGGAGSSRLSTILPLVRLVLQIVIVVMTTLIALGSLGIDTTPLLAGAGIAGIAIGFGAQKLVTDVVSGIFFLIDDAFRAGEYVMIEGTVGTVEKISMRSMQLRHHRGAIHTIPYGEIPKITNYSRDWVIVKLPFTVPFDTDLQKVKKIFKQIGKDLMLIPEYKDDLLQPFKSQGVMEVNEVGIVVRGKFMAKPGKQFVLSKEIYQRVQTAFDANGLQFARKEVRVKLDGAEPEALSEPEQVHIAAAAADVSEEAKVNHEKTTEK